MGDWVFLRLQPYKQKTISMRHSMKLAARFCGPFQVLQKIGSIAYKLSLPASSRTHPVFYVSCLEKKLGQNVTPLPTLPPTDSQGQIQPEPEQILERRMRKCGNHALTEVLIKWVGAPV